MLAKVDKFSFLADFVVLDIEEDRGIPLILERPFLASDGALIDVQKAKLKLQVNDQKVKFKIYHTLKFPKKGTHLPLSKHD